MPALQYADTVMSTSQSLILLQSFLMQVTLTNLIRLIFCTFHVSYLVILVYGQSEIFLLCWLNVNRQVLFGGLLTPILTLS